MYSAHDVAVYIINWCNEHRISISNLKLQKLLYFVQGEASARSPHRLIDDDFYAWQLGPVVPHVYSDYAMYSSSQIPKQIVRREISDGEKSIIDMALVKYASYTPWALVEKSHNQDPWKYNYTIFGDRALIPYQSIKDYFSGGDAR